MMYVEFSIAAEQDDSHVRGNAMASGDDDFDRKCEDAIIADVNDGNVWAWASVEVAARIGSTECRDHVSGCQYRDQADFEGDATYLDMKGEALSGLRDMLEGALDSAERDLAAERKAWEKRQAEYEKWACADCDNGAHVHPDEYETVGCPVCSDCDQEMERVDDVN